MYFDFSPTGCFVSIYDLCSPKKFTFYTVMTKTNVARALVFSKRTSHTNRDVDVYKNKRPALVFSQTTQKIQIKILTSNKPRMTRTTSKIQVVSAAPFSRRTPDTWSKLVHIAKVQHKRMGSAGWHVVISEDTQTEFLPSLP